MSGNHCPILCSLEVDNRLQTTAKISDVHKREKKKKKKKER